MKWLRRLIVSVLLVGLVYVSSTLPDANSVLVNVDLLLWQAPPLPLWLALGLSFLIGVLCASAGLLYQLAKKSLVARRYRKTVAGLESEIHQLRNLPLAGSESVNGGAAEDSSVPGAP
ncbi:MAG: LapA family protein [bacterium]|nr:LapA family protein [bacterium]MCP5065523.1 LapA family protein [bacterium]